MKIGIVGAEGAKFTPRGEDEARLLIAMLLSTPNAILVSGGCHLGGIDIWAEECADRAGIQKIIYLPREHSWPHYKYRNLQIATTADIVHCITVDRLPQSFKGMTFHKCYHCDKSDHIKSGGCWTMKKAKHGQLHIITN